jgi:hypothetical protein
MSPRKRIDIQVACGSKANAINFSRSSGAQKSSAIFQNALMVSYIYGIIPEWKPGEKFFRLVNAAGR